VPWLACARAARPSSHIENANTRRCGSFFVQLNLESADDFAKQIHRDKAVPMTSIAC
jgi:hypothetical protein